MQNEQLEREVINDIKALLSKSGYSELIDSSPGEIAKEMVRALQEDKPTTFDGNLEVVTITASTLTNAITVQFYKDGRLSLYLLSILLMMALDEAEQIFNEAEGDDSFVFNEEDVTLLTEAADTLVEAVQKIKGQSPLVN